MKTVGKRWREVMIASHRLIVHVHELRANHVGWLARFGQVPEFASLDRGVTC